MVLILPDYFSREQASVSNNIVSSFCFVVLVGDQNLPFKRHSYEVEILSLILPDHLSGEQGLVSNNILSSFCYLVLVGDLNLL